MQVEDDGTRLLVRDGGAPLVEYVYTPTQDQVESPRPYALLRGRDGTPMTAYRPDDHRWHRGISLALPAVGTENFWGGPTYVGDEGYVQLENNGTQVHRGFAWPHDPTGDVRGVTRIDESLEWISQSGEQLLTERRALTVRLVGERAWALTWRSELRNVADRDLAFGSPTTKGRPNAGYAGIFWRGPEAFTGGEIVGADGIRGDDARGERAPWLAFVAPDRRAGLLMLDASTSAQPWFARSQEYAGLNPAPFFFRETRLPPGGTLALAAAVLLADADVASLASTVGADLVDELRAGSPPPAEHETTRSETNP